MELAGPPPPDVAVPDVVRELAGGRPIQAVWRNQLGGVTFRLGTGGPYVKWSPTTSAAVAELADERARLAWIDAQSSPPTVPRVLGHGTDEHGSWLLTAPIEGENAVTPRWKAQPARAAAGIGAGLRRFHDALDPATCPFRSGAWHTMTIDDQPRPPIDGSAVVVHGDACAPNTLLDETGAPAGHVDLGALAVGDRWADLAIATWSLDWNYGPGYARDLLDAYGIAPDPERIAHYRALWRFS